ncbi:MAG TPA: C40 family peptidase [Acidimicrobiales bacterium]|nr:C40 family peptidase [Acidimicrobiales bacterium]
MARGAMVAALIGFAGTSASVLAGFLAPSAGATTTTTPGPTQAQINATKSQVATIESTLTQEEQETSVLDDRYDTAIQNLQTAQSALTTIKAALVRTKAAVAVDRHRLTNDAVKAYIYGTPQSSFTSLFSSSATLGNARMQYTQQIVGNLNQARNALQVSQSHLAAQDAQEENLATQAQSEANQAKTLAASNAAEAAATKQTLSSVQGQLAAEVAQAAVIQAQQAAAAAAKAASAAQAQREAAAAAAAATVAQAVGGAASGASATTAANQAAGTGRGSVGPVSGSSSGASQQESAIQAAVSQLGVPYVFGGESPGHGFDCSGLVQWAWAQAGISIPRTTESQWPALAHVSLSALEPGDLLFYYNLDGDDEVDHVVMYVGSGPYGTQTVIQAPFTGSTVSYSPIFTSGLIGAGRP